MRAKRQVKNASRRSGPVTISYLPGFEPPPEPETKYPFRATINGIPVMIYRDRTEYL
jgi:hypothetical protein